jgi:hypothetical protein
MYWLMMHLYSCWFFDNVVFNGLMLVFWLWWCHCYYDEILLKRMFKCCWYVVLKCCWSVAKNSIKVLLKILLKCYIFMQILKFNSIWSISMEIIEEQKQNLKLNSIWNLIQSFILNHLYLLKSGLGVKSQKKTQSRDKITRTLLSFYIIFNIVNIT